jgi:iron transport multicopper oxidase
LFSDSTLINGLGRAWGNTKNTTLSVTTVTRGLRYRLRIVSMSCFPAFAFSIDGHTLSVIEADGVVHQPYPVDSVTLYAGQRYSAILTANQTVGNYWIRALPIIDGLSSSDAAAYGTFTNGINSAILRYSGASSSDPTTPLVASKNSLVESKLVPYVKMASPGPTDSQATESSSFHRYDLDFTLDYSSFKYVFNSTVHTLPSVPVLEQLLSAGSSIAGLVPVDQYIAIPANATVQLTLHGGDSGQDTHHSIHLHGHTFSVVRSTGQSSYNWANPPRRDTINTGMSGDVVTIRFTADNSGPWILYDHIAWHSVAGYMVMLCADRPASRACAAPLMRASSASRIHRQISRQASTLPPLGTACVAHQPVLRPRQSR